MNNDFRKVSVGNVLDDGWVIIGRNSKTGKVVSRSPYVSEGRCPLEKLRSNKKGTFKATLPRLPDYFEMVAVEESLRGAENTGFWVDDLRPDKRFVRVRYPEQTGWLNPFLDSAQIVLVRTEDKLELVEPA